MYDLLIKNASVIDGSGAAPFVSDVAVKDGKIACIAEALTDAQTVIDASGLTLSPGWIDSHSHSDKTILTYPEQREKVEQGVTFSITGQCGFSPAPNRNADGSYETMGDFLKKAVSVSQGSGAAMLVGHCTLRKAVMGFANRAPEPEEMEQMKKLLCEGLDAGAIGMSIGLFYMPGCYAEIDEVIQLAKVVARKNGVITSHIRNEGDQLIEAVEEFITIVKESGCRGVLSHHKAMGPNNWGKVKQTVAMIEKANAEGADIYWDVYPYCASGTSLLARFLPKQFHPAGTNNVIKLLDDPVLCKKIKQWGVAQWGEDLDWVMLQGYGGLTVKELAQQRGQEDQYQTAFDLIRESDGNARGYFFLTNEDDLRYVMQHPRGMICTDSAAAGNLEMYHPRLHGSFPRTLAKYVREQKLTTLPEMIRKMTSLPAAVYGLEGKGRIAVGADADICIFDADAITDRADYQNCALNNEGLQYVIIDGKIVLKNGVYNGTRAAKVLTACEQAGFVV